MDDMAEADYILQQYSETWCDQVSRGSGEELCGTMRALAALGGRFALILYDGGCRRLVVARDAEGAEPLFWGRTQLGLLLCSDM